MPAAPVGPLTRLPAAHPPAFRMIKAQAAFDFDFIDVEKSIVETGTFLMAKTGK
jgi:hypothetical protein